MNVKRITTIMPIEMLASLEKHLRDCGVPGVTVEHVNGYGEHPNFFRHDLMRDNVRAVLYADESKVDEYVDAIKRCARDSAALTGILAVESIDRLEHLIDDDDVATR